LKHLNDLTPAEEKLAAVIWQNAPLSSPALVDLAKAELSWQKSTTYTILKKLIAKGLFKNENAQIMVLLSKQQHLTRLSRNYVTARFDGSLPKFIAAFLAGKKLSAKQSAELSRLIEESRK